VIYKQLSIQNYDKKLYMSGAVLSDLTKSIAAIHLKKSEKSEQSEIRLNKGERKSCFCKIVRHFLEGYLFRKARLYLLCILF